MAAAIGLPIAHAADHVSLRNGFDLICDHRSTEGDKTRLYLTAAGDSSFVEVATADIVSVDQVAAIEAGKTVPDNAASVKPQSSSNARLTDAELHELLTAAGAARNLDVDLLACVVRAESGGNAHAVSRTGAQGLMQLMPGTAAELGVTDSFRADQNVNGGTAYLNALLLRYHDNLALALAAYNAGPKAVERYRGIPPYRETRAYVARIIHEFNQRKAAEAAAVRRTERASNKSPNPGESHASQSE